MSQSSSPSHRPQGTANVRVFTPTVAEHGWSAGGHTVVEVVTDDMPFLVDSVTMELNEQGRDVHMVVHPQILVRRDVTGQLLEVLDDERSPSTPTSTTSSRESWMHVEIDRESDRRGARRDRARRCARCCATSARPSRTGRRCTRRRTTIVDDLTEHPPPLPSRGGRARARRCCSWLADDHFTFLGYREYHLDEPSTATDDVLRAVPGTGLGILRADQDMSAVVRQAAAARARRRRARRRCWCWPRPTPRSTVHRPVYLDYVGVKTFDENGEVVGERRFLGLFSSAAYTESLTRIPVLREKADAA